MLILGIETSCDETAAAVVEDGRRVLSNAIATQDELHREYRGVVPEIASRAHTQRILPIVEQAIGDAGVTLGDIDAIAVGNRPGLIGSLLVGVGAAKALSWSLGVPLIGVDHVQAHLYSGCLERDSAAFPAIGLAVSGGHTSIYRMDSPVSLTRLGATIDDALGEAYDKAAAILGLGYPGGPRVDALAQAPGADDRAVELPVSRLGKDSLDFSFSGLKTALLYKVRGLPGPGGVFKKDNTSLGDDERRDLAASFQRVASKAVIVKLGRAVEHLEREGVECRSLLTGGGVTANTRLRQELTVFAQERDLELRLPEIRYCLDNAAMIAGLGYQLLQSGNVDDLHLRATPTTAC